MKRSNLFAAPAVVLALCASPAAPQQDVDNRRDGDLNVTVTLGDPSQSGAAARSLPLPIDGRTSSSPPAPTPIAEQIRLFNSMAPAQQAALIRELQRSLPPTQRDAIIRLLQGEGNVEEAEAALEKAIAERGARFQPADFARPNRLEALHIDADDLPRQRPAVAVRCQAFIGRDGGLGEYFCTSDDYRSYQAVVTAVIMAVPTQRFVAARVDGENVRVLMNFAVYVDCSSGSCFVVGARNHGYHAQELGLDYVDPQPILERDAWYDGFDYKLRWARSWMPRTTDRQLYSKRLRYVMAAEIDANGIAGAGCLAWVGVGANMGSAGQLLRTPSVPMVPASSKTDLEGAIASLRNVRYVPGMVDGSPATLRLYEESVVEAVTPASTGNRSAVFSILDIGCEQLRR